MTRQEQPRTPYEPDLEEDWLAPEEEQVIEGDLSVRAVVVGLLVG